MDPRKKRKMARIAATSAIVLIVFGLIPVVMGGGGAGGSAFLALFVVLNLLGGICLLVLAAVLNTGGLVELLRSRSSRMTSNSMLYSTFVVGILILVNVVAVRHGTRWDLTAEQRFTLSEQSRKIVDALPGEVVFRAFYGPQRQAEVKDLLGKYGLVSDAIRIEYIDPMQRPMVARTYGIVDDGTVHISAGGEQVRITDPDEEKITNALIKVTQGEARVVYLLQGHGEPELADAESGRGYGELARALEGENYRVEELLLMTRGEVPADATVLIAAGAVRPYFPEEIEAIDRYLEGGGRLLALLEPSYDATTGELAATGLEGLLGNRGIEVGENLVLDLEFRLFAGPRIGLAPGADSYGMHEITEDMSEITFFESYVREVAPAVDHAGSTVTTLVRTAESSWAESDLRGIFEEQEAGRDEQDAGGPISVAVAYERESAERDDAQDPVRTRIVAFGDAGFVDNGQLLQIKANEDLVLNSVAWLADRGELISIRPRRATASRLVLRPEETRTILVASVFLLPELILLTGLLVWQRRR